ncbi:MAG: futalosine hydrolase [Bacteroidota bacterium]
MKQILIVSATRQELMPFLQHFNFQLNASDPLQVFEWHQTKISILISGVGMVNTAYQLGKISHSTFDLVLNVGIAGTFRNDLSLGECVLVMRDELAEMGAENGTDFILFQDLHLGGTSQYSGKYDQQYAILNDLKNVSGITVNKVHGDEVNIHKTIKLFNADIESMEGAAFYRSAENMAPIIIQLRSISNLIEKRDKSKWQMALAIQNLNNTLIQLMEQFA